MISMSLLTMPHMELTQFGEEKEMKTPCHVGPLNELEKLDKARHLGGGLFLPFLLCMQWVLFQNIFPLHIIIINMAILDETGIQRILILL